MRSRPLAVVPRKGELEMRNEEGAVEKDCTSYQSQPLDTDRQKLYAISIALVRGT